jgi:CubicO group peptidase (beta-lactamase class C family)
MPALTRRNALLATGATLMAFGAKSPAANAFAWQPIAPADAGFAPDIGARLDDLVSSGRAWKQHGVVIVRGGRLVLERYFDGEDQTWGRPLGRVAFGPDTLHDLRSVTKSVVGFVYGIALAAGKVPAPEAPLMASFPEYADLAADPQRQRLTIGHVLTMTLGLEWNENIPYENPANSERAMEVAPDRYRYILERPVVAAPGERWTYGGGATALLGKLIAKGTGQSLEDYARAVLFDPLGIGRTEWSKGRDGVASAASGLRMTPRDLARVGQLILNGGRWEGRSVVPPAWLETSLRVHATVDEFRRYGYHWYSGVAPSDAKVRWIGAFGYGGQRLFVLPDLDIAVAITAGNYTDPQQGIPSLRIVRELVLTGLR